MIVHFARAPKTNLTFDSIALTDVIINLFIFFFITFNLIATFGPHKESPLRLNLPAAKSGGEEAVRGSHDIHLSRSGSLYWDDAKISLADLENRLGALRDKSMPITLRADRNASVQSLTSVLDIARRTGTKNLSLQTKLST